MQSQHWSVLEGIMRRIAEQVRQESPVRQSEWESIVAMLEAEGQIKGINRLLQELYALAQKD
jgi:hypothetical protein